MTNATIDLLLGVQYAPDPRVRRVTQTLAESGYRVRVLAWDRLGGRPALTKDGRVIIEHVHVPSRSGRGWTQAFFLLPLAASYARRVRRRRPAILHAVDLPMLVVAILVRLFLRPRPILVFEAFEIYAAMVSHRMPALALRVIRGLENRLPKLADLVITPGESRQAYFAERGVGSVCVPNWIDPPKRRIARGAAREALGIAPGQFSIAYAGSLNGARDLEPLIRYAKRGGDVLVLIAGEGDDRRRLESLAANAPNIRFLGWLPNPTGLLAAADVLYYALRTDHPYAPYAAPNNLYVAIAHAVPLIYRPQGELAVIGERYVLGVPFHDDDSLRRAIDDLRQPDRNVEVRRALRAIRGDFSWSRAAHRLVSAYPRNGTVSSKENPNGP